MLDAAGNPTAAALTCGPPGDLRAPTRGAAGPGWRWPQRSHLVDQVERADDPGYLAVRKNSINDP